LDRHEALCCFRIPEPGIRIPPVQNVLTGARVNRGGGMEDKNGRADIGDQPVSELVKQLSDQTTTLVRKEVELAKAELAEKGKKAGLGAGMFGGAGFFGFFAFGGLTATFILALTTAVSPWLAALIVTAVYGAIAGVLALQGKKKVKEAGPPVPERAVDSTKEDVAWVKTRAKSARQ
jgi:uncharacterized membrane protein YqjE